MSSKKESPEWVEIDPIALTKSDIKKLQGVEVRVTVSPYDVPEAVRGNFHPKKQKFIIEFKYLATEPSKTESVDEHLSFKVGTHSGRLQSIEIDVERLEANAVLLRVEQAIKTLERQPARQQRRENYRIAGEVISNERSKIFPPQLRAS